MKITSATVKRMVSERSDIKISSSAAAAIAKALEKRAKAIAKYAVKRAKKQGRSTVLSEDIDYYRMKFGD